MGTTNTMLFQVFGLLMPVEVHDKDAQGRVRYLCNCECGRTKVVTSSNLRNGRSQSCGRCARQGWTPEQRKNRRRTILAQRAADFAVSRTQTFGWLTPMLSGERDGEEFWVCACRCGRTHGVLAKKVRHGSVSSCGCGRGRQRERRARRMFERRQACAA